MSTLVKAVLATTVISVGSAVSPKLKAEPYCCPQPAICDAICASACCTKKRTSKLLVPVLPQSAAVQAPVPS